jgi:Ion channel
MPRSAEVALGSLILIAVLHDLFQSVVLPRPSIGRWRISQLTLRPLWASWRWLGARLRRIDRRENWLATFGPVAVIALLGMWVVGLTVAYGLLIDGVRDQIQPAPASLGTSLYLSAATLFPLSYGDFLPMGAGARIVAVAETATGVALIALVISLLFSLYRSFQDREELVVTLDALAGAPPSGVQILEVAAQYHMPDTVSSTFDDWRRWSAAVLESHLAYPILVYFRSSHDNEAWVNSFGAVMDAATLVISSIDAESLEGSAHLLLKVGNHLVEDLGWYFRLERSPSAVVERQEFDEARGRLQAAGYRCRGSDAAWADFVSLRSRYALPLNQLARRMAIRPAQWIGDRSYLPHAKGSRARP